MESLSGHWDYTFEESSGSHDWDFWNTFLPNMLKHFGFAERDRLGVMEPVEHS